MSGITNEENEIMITHGGKEYKIIFTDDVVEIDAKDVVTVHYNNIIGEYIVFPVVLQRVGFLLADVKNRFAYSKAGLEYKEAELRKKYRIEYETISEDEPNLTPSGKISKTAKPAKKLTVQELTDYVLLDPEYNEYKEQVIIDESIVNKIESLYWSCKAKYDTVVGISTRLNPEEFKMDAVRKSLQNLNAYGCNVEEMGDF